MTGNLLNSGDIRGINLVAGETSFQLLINPPSSSTTHARISTIQQGVGFYQNLALQTDGGNVGIGITNPNSKLYVYETTDLNANATINGDTSMIQL